MLIPLRKKYLTHQSPGHKSRTANSQPKGKSIWWHLNHPKKRSKTSKGGKT